MEFGYFTLSDNHYADNSRSPNKLVTDIAAEALYAEELGMHSAWIGEHHFNSLGILDYQLLKTISGCLHSPVVHEENDGAFHRSAPLPPRVGVNPIQRIQTE